MEKQKRYKMGDSIWVKLFGPNWRSQKDSSGCCVRGKIYPGEIKSFCIGAGGEFYLIKIEGINNDHKDHGLFWYVCENNIFYNKHNDDLVARDPAFGGKDKPKIQNTKHNKEMV